MSRRVWVRLPGRCLAHPLLRHLHPPHSLFLKAGPRSVWLQDGFVWDFVAANSKLTRGGGGFQDTPSRACVCVDRFNGYQLVDGPYGSTCNMDVKQILVPMPSLGTRRRCITRGPTEVSYDGDRWGPSCGMLKRVGHTKTGHQQTLPGHRRAW